MLCHLYHPLCPDTLPSNLCKCFGERICVYIACWDVKCGLSLVSGVSPLDMDWLDTSQRQEPCARMGMVKSASPTSLKGLRPTQVPSSSARLLSRPSVRWLSSDFMSLDASVTSVTPVSTTLPSPAPAAHPPSGRNTFEMATPASGNVFCPFDGSYQFPTLVFRSVVRISCQVAG